MANFVGNIYYLIRQFVSNGLAAYSIAFGVEELNDLVCCETMTN